MNKANQCKRDVPQQTLRFSRMQMLYHPGDPAESVFRVQDGLIRMARMTQAGRQVTLRHVVPGDFFGEEALTESKRKEVAESLTIVEIEVIDPQRLNHRDLLMITQSLSTQIQRLMTFECHLQIGDLRQRVARYLLSLCDTPLFHLAHTGRPIVSVSHELIAEGSAATRESVSKIISELRVDGLIESGYRSIVLLDLPALKNAANGRLLA